MKLKIIIPILVLFYIYSCQPKYNKDDYLNNYESFVLRIKQNWEDYSKDDWIKYDKENSKYYEDDYKLFAGELKPSEIIRVHRFNFVYNFYRGEINITNLLSGEYNNVFKGMAIETNEIIRELNLILNDFETENNFVIIEKLLE